MADILRYYNRKTMPRLPSTSASVFRHQEAIRRNAERFERIKAELQRLECICKGTVLKRMMKCGKARCACASDPTKRHGPYFELTYKSNGKTVNIALSADAAPLYQAASRQYRKLKALITRLETLSKSMLRHQAEIVPSKRPG